MDKHGVAAVLEEIAVLLELQGENPFRCRAYSNAARTIEKIEEDLADIVASGRLSAIPGIGEVLREKITALVTTGQLSFYDDLKAKTPPGLLQLLRLPGLGPKKIKALHEALAIDDLPKLLAACQTGKVAELKGFGAKTQAKILEGIAFLDQMGQRVRLDLAGAIADAIVGEIRKCPGIIRLEVCGSLRRRRETVNDIDLLISSKDAASIMDAFVHLPWVRSITGHGETKSSVVVAIERIVLNADLRVVDDKQFPFALNYFTGSKEHNVAMRQRAIEYGWKLNEYELTGAKGSVACQEEADIYKALDLEYIPPELRENTGEIEAAAANSLPALIEADDITGVFHCHTTWSDGTATLEQMALAAKNLGYKYLGIGDHSQSLNVANGLSPARLVQQQAEIDAVNAKLKGFHVFKGTECDILPDGRLDYSDEVLESFDYVVASVHTHFHLSKSEMTARIQRALRHPKVRMLGHATGRLILRREAYAVDVEAVLQTAAETGTMIEINASPHRLDIDWVQCKRAKALGVLLVINPDAHSTAEIAQTVYGVDVARRGWLEKGNVFNTRPLAEIKKVLSTAKATGAA